MQFPIIRLATGHDIEQIATLYTEFHEFHVRGVPDRLRSPSFTPKEAADNQTSVFASLRQIIQGNGSAIFVAESGEQLVGLAEVYIKQDGDNPLAVSYRYAYLQSLLVSETYRKGGLGRQLMNAAQQWAREHDAAEMRLEAWEFQEGPLHFYEKMGYRTLKREMVMGL